MVCVALIAVGVGSFEVFLFVVRESLDDHGLDIVMSYIMFVVSLVVRIYSCFQHIEDLMVSHHQSKSRV